MWKFLKSHWIMSLIGLAILLTAATMLVYAIATREGDVGLMTNTKGKPLRWKSTPITCIYDSDKMTSPDALNTYDRVREKINSRFSKNFIGPCIPWALERDMPKVINGEMILNISQPPEPEEGVIVYDPFEPKAGGTAHIMEGEDGHIAAAVLYIYPDAVGDERVWLHELGHIMGLAHDRRRDSVMYPTLTDRGRDLSEKDIKYLREAYQ